MFRDPLRAVFAVLTAVFALIGGVSLCWAVYDLAFANNQFHVDAETAAVCLFLGWVLDKFGEAA